MSTLQEQKWTLMRTEDLNEIQRCHCECILHSQCSCSILWFTDDESDRETREHAKELLHVKVVDKCTLRDRHPPRRSGRSQHLQQFSGFSESASHHASASGGISTGQSHSIPRRCDSLSHQAPRALAALLRSVPTRKVRRRLALMPPPNMARQRRGSTKGFGRGRRRVSQERFYRRHGRICLRGNRCYRRSRKPCH